MSSVPQQQHCSFIASHQYIFLLSGAWDWTYMWLKTPKTSNFITCNKLKTSLETGRLIQSESDMNSRHRKDFSNLKKKMIWKLWKIIESPLAALWYDSWWFEVRGAGAPDSNVLLHVERTTERQLIQKIVCHFQCKRPSARCPVGRESE